MERYDAVIVGGGPAGSACARQLHQAGLDVLVLDKKAFPRDKVCAGWITPAVIEALHIDVEEYRQGRVFQPITGFLVGWIDGLAAETRYGWPVSYGIRRCEFDHYLLARSGARLRLGEALQTLTRANDEWLLNASIKTPLVIGAGGHFCPVARFLGAQLGSNEQVIAAQEIEFEMSRRQADTCRVRPDMPEIYFCADLKGYGWCFRKGDFLNIGLGREDNHKLAEHVSAFSQFLKRQKRIPQDVPDRFSGHAYLLYTHAPRKLLDDGVLLIGDAAGLAYPQSGEGIRPAIESGLMAAEVVFAARGNYRRENLEDYRARLIARFGTRNKMDISHLFPQRLKETIAKKLIATHWFSRHVILDRWFLHRHKPLLTAEKVH